MLLLQSQWFYYNNEYERHGVKCHVGLPLYPGSADIAKHKIISQDTPWEKEIKSDLNFHFELDPNSTNSRRGKEMTSSPSSGLG